MSIELITAIAALIVAISGVAYNAIRIDMQRRQMKAEQQKWEREVERGITQAVFQEQSLKLYEARLKAYDPIWPLLKLTAGYEWRRLGGEEKAKDSQEESRDAVQTMADALTGVAYSNAGMLMSEESRTHLTNLRQGCGAFLNNGITFSELGMRAYWFKHSLRADLHIPSKAIENEEFKKITDGIRGLLQGKENSTLIPYTPNQDQDLE